MAREATLCFSRFAFAAAAAVVLVGCSGSGSTPASNSIVPGEPVTSDITTPATWDSIETGQVAALRHAFGTEARDFRNATRVMSKYEDADGVKLILFANEPGVVTNGGMSGSVVHRDGKAIALVRQGNEYDPTHFEGVLFSQAYDEALASLAAPKARPTRETIRTRNLRVPIRLGADVDPVRVDRWVARAKARGFSAPKYEYERRSAPPASGRATESLGQGTMYAGMWCKYMYYYGHVSASLGGNKWLTLGHGLTDVPTPFKLPVQRFYGYQEPDGYFNGHVVGDLGGQVQNSLWYGTVIDSVVLPTMHRSETTVMGTDGTTLKSLSDYFASDYGSFEEYISVWLLLDQQLAKLLYEYRNVNKPFRLVFTVNYEGGAYSSVSEDTFSGRTAIADARDWIDWETTYLMFDAFGREMTSNAKLTVKFEEPED